MHVTFYGGRPQDWTLQKSPDPPHLKPGNCSAHSPHNEAA
jgi:hypothetical protein